MDVTSFSYRSPRSALTRHAMAAEETGLNFTADVSSTLFATDHREADASAPTSTSTSTTDEPGAARGSVEAARHNVLRRLAPALKHDMVVNLQAVSMMAEMLNARLERSGPDSADLQANISKLNRLAREAVVKCLNVSSWIDPGEDDTVPLHEGVAECVSLMGGSLNFRGFNLVSDVQPTEFEVCRGALRNLLAASLLTLADSSAAPADLVLRAQVSGQAILTITCEGEGDEPARVSFELPSPRLAWEDVQELAAAESVELSRNGNQIVMRLPRAMPSSPLGMVPM